MSFPTTPSYVPQSISVYYHRVREGETSQDIANKYSVNLQKAPEMPTNVLVPGQLIAIDFKASLAIPLQ